MVVVEGWGLAFIVSQDQGQARGPVPFRSRRSGLASTMVPSSACGVKVTNRSQAEGRTG